MKLSNFTALSLPRILFNKLHYHFTLYCCEYVVNLVSVHILLFDFRYFFKGRATKESSDPSISLRLYR